MIYYARVAYNSVDIDSDMGIIINQGILLSRCIAYYFAYAIVFNVVKKKFNKYNLLYFIPIIIYFFDLILSTQRANMIAFVSFVLIIYMIIIRKEEVNTKKSNFRILKFGAVGAVILVVVFTFLGLFTGKTQSLGIINSLLIYTGSSILALNQWLLDPTTSAFFGESTLRLFYAGIGKFGFDVPIYNEYFFEHVQIGENVRTNIFTPLRRYIQDYSYTGLFFIQFITGLIYGFFIKVLVNSKYAGLGLILYANFFYPIFSASIEERIMTNYLSLTTIYTVFYFVIIVIVFNKFIKLKNKEDSIQK
jgi:oligosaccharide repeat unit polymerase